MTGDESAHGFQPWLVTLRAGAVVAPSTPREPLFSRGLRIGSIEPELVVVSQLDRLLHEGTPLLRRGRQTEAGHNDNENEAAGWHVDGDTTRSLALVAGHLRAAGFAGAWRDEQLAVNGPDGQRLGTVERGVVRALGIPTLAVHLVGSAPDGRFWIQQRAFDKPNDPGMWDTLMGGMVSAADSVETALARETWEEAGLHTDQLQHLRHGGRLETARPGTDGRMGYVTEFIDWYTCTVPDGVTPVNQDGEVEQFVLMTAGEVIARMGEGEFTTEAALILADVMGL
ncbi:MAG: NUDIX domain-containing protein [Comamonadaceae bacterium]|nr:MAG: NUDIX domain-containing protein [Comamonadaceae bacterium]